MPALRRSEFRQLEERDVNESLDQIQTRRLQERPFLSLEEFSSEQLARALRTESAAVAALVLAHLAPALSAEVLSSFEAELALEVVSRMANLTPPGFETLQSIAQDLGARIQELGSTPGQYDRNGH